jgi:hypothetical protein
LSSVTAKLNDAIIFFGKRKSTELFWIWDSEKWSSMKN